VTIRDGRLGIWKVSSHALPAVWLQWQDPFPCKIDWLIDWCFTARQHKICQFVPINRGEILAQAFEDSQRGTYKKYSGICDTMNIHMQRQQQVCLTCLKINNTYNKLHDPEWIEKRSRRTTPSLSIFRSYVSAFTTNSQISHPVRWYIHSVWLQFSVMPSPSSPFLPRRHPLAGWHKTRLLLHSVLATLNGCSWWLAQSYVTKSWRSGKSSGLTEIRQICKFTKFLSFSTNCLRKIERIQWAGHLSYFRTWSQNQR